MPDKTDQNTNQAPHDDINFKNTLKTEANVNNARNRIIAGIIIFIILILVFAYLSWQDKNKPQPPTEILPNTSLSDVNNSIPTPNLPLIANSNNPQTQSFL